MFPSPRLFEYGNEVIHEKPEGIKKMASDGKGCAMALMWDGRLFAAGNNQYYQYGNGTTQTNANSNYKTWTLVQENVDDVCCNNTTIAGTFVIRKGTELFFSGSKIESWQNTVQTWTLIQDVSSLLVEPDDYIKEIRCTLMAIVILIRNERLGTGKVYARGDSQYLGIGVNVSDYTKFQLSTTAPDNVVKLSSGDSAYNVYLLTQDNILMGTGDNWTNYQQLADTSTLKYYSYIQIDTGVYNMQCCGEFIMFLKADGIYRRGNTTSAGLPGGSTKSIHKVTSLTVPEALRSKILLEFINTFDCALSIPAGVECTAPTAVGVNWGNTSNKQFTIRQGTENKEVQQLVGGYRGVLYQSDNVWYTFSSNPAPNVNGVIVVPE